MAGINTLKPLFSGKLIENIFDQFQENIHGKIIEVYRYLGEQFVNKARISGNYKDRTGNLRSSIGYIILYNGKIVEKNFIGKKHGKSKGLKVAKQVALEHPEGYVLIGVAGMQYAAYVEAKNYDVITGSEPEIELLKSLLNEIEY